MDIILLSLILLLAISFLYLAIFKKQLIFGILSGICIIFCGLFCWNGIKYVSSTIITTVNSTTITAVDVYSSWNYVFVGTSISVCNALGSLFILIGLFVFIIFTLMIFRKNRDVDTEQDDGED